MTKEDRPSHKKVANKDIPMKYAYIFAAASLGMLAACSGLDELDLDNKSILDEGELVEKVTFEAPSIRSLGEDGETRASLSQNGDDILFCWEATDTVGIYPDQGAQVYFSMEDGVGTNVASFDGGGWSLRKGYTYSCYYPFVGSIYLNRNAIPVSFANQQQTGLSSYKGVRFYIASEGTSSSTSGDLHFSFQMLNTVIRIKAIGLPAGTYTKLSVTTAEPLFVKDGTFGLDDMKITGKTFSNSLEIALKDFTLTETSTEANPAIIYITAAPIDLSGKEVTVRVFSDDGIYKRKTTPTRAYNAGEWNGWKLSMEKESVLYYTSLNNDIVTPANADAFGATIVSNEYVGSRGILAFDGDVTQIGDHAFENCSTLTGIEIPATVTIIGDYAFAGCSNLGSNNTPTSMTQMLHAMSPLRSGETSFIIPDGVTSIGAYAFQNCTSLTSITIPNSVTSIGEGAFYGCENLSSINIPDNVAVIGDNAFYGCGGLTSFIIPDGVTSIGSYAFQSCSGLTSIIIPENVSYIGVGAFNGCTGLTYITEYAVIPPEAGGNELFENTNDCPIYVPSASVNAYKTTAGWSNYASRIGDHFYVEMGNGMKWATTNVGAIGPDDLGNYYSWGGTMPITMPVNGSVSFNDTATAIWGGSWRMPTLEEWSALKDTDNFTWTWIPDKKGYMVESKITGYVGNKIFLPAAGVIAEPGLLYLGSEGDYWANSLRTEGSGWSLFFDSSGVFTGDYGCGGGLSVRPVFESNNIGNLENPNDSGNEINL